MKRVVVVDGCRTPLVDSTKPSNVILGRREKRGRGHLVPPSFLLVTIVRGLMKRTGLKAKDIFDIIVGCALPERSQGANVGRLIPVILAKLDNNPDWLYVLGMTVNRLCTSSMEAIHIAYSKLLSGQYLSNGFDPIYLPLGVEDMGKVPMMDMMYYLDAWTLGQIDPLAMNMGLTAEALAKMMGITKDEIDEWAYQSNLRALKAAQSGSFKEEIEPVHFVWPEQGIDILIEEDDSPKGLNREKIGKMGGAFDKKGIVSAAGSSRTTVGAAGVVLTTDDMAAQLGLTPKAIIVATYNAAYKPELMGYSVIPAIDGVLKQANMTVDQINLFEINAAFTPVPLAAIKHFKLDPEKVNVLGGAEVLGHPLAATGARMTITGINETKRRGQKYLLVTMCVGFGMGGAAIYEVL